MAYLRELTPKLCGICGKEAKYELVDFRNESRGFFCTKHSAVALGTRKKLEMQAFNSTPSRPL
jgi:hypothetical protein